MMPFALRSQWREDLQTRLLMDPLEISLWAALPIKVGVHVPQYFHLRKIESLLIATFWAPKQIIIALRLCQVGFILDKMLQFYIESL